MPRLFTDNTAFDPDAIKAMTSAYDHLCVALDLVGPDDARSETMAKKIIEHARRGEKEPIALCALVLKDLRNGSL